MSSILFDDVSHLARALKTSLAITEDAQARQIAETVIKYGKAKVGSPASVTTAPPLDHPTHTMSVTDLAHKIAASRQIGLAEAQIMAFDIAYPKAKSHEGAGVTELAHKIAAEQKIDFAEAQVIAFNIAYPKATK